MLIEKQICLPLTLHAKERAVFQAWPRDIRERFQDKAGLYEFVRGLSVDDAEAQAFTECSVLHSQRIASAAK